MSYAQIGDENAGAGEDARLECEDWYYVRGYPTWTLPKEGGVHRYGVNCGGRDYVVGDVHGAWSKVEQALDAIRFDPAKDRLFSVGDLVDRGQHSAGCTDWCAKPWFNAIRGNHDQLCLDAEVDSLCYGVWMSNGGQWAGSVDKGTMEQVRAALHKLPWAIEVETEANGMVGLVHADTPKGMSWGEYRGLLVQGDRQATCFAVWSREWKRPGNKDHVAEGIDWVVCGHTVHKHAKRGGNRVWIDTGAAYQYPGAGVLTMLEITSPGFSEIRVGKPAT